MLVELVLLFWRKPVFAIAGMIEVSVVDSEVFQRRRSIFLLVWKVVLLSVLVEDLFFHPVSDLYSGAVF